MNNVTEFETENVDVACGTWGFTLSLLFCCVCLSHYLDERVINNYNVACTVYCFSLQNVAACACCISLTFSLVTVNYEYCNFIPKTFSLLNTAVTIAGGAHAWGASGALPPLPSLHIALLTDKQSRQLCICCVSFMPHQQAHCHDCYTGDIASLSVQVDQSGCSAPKVTEWQWHFSADGVSLAISHHDFCWAVQLEVCASLQTNGLCKRHDTRVITYKMSWSSHTFHVSFWRLRVPLQV